MVLKPDPVVDSRYCEFENDVKMYGTQTLPRKSSGPRSV